MKQSILSKQGMSFTVARRQISAELIDLVAFATEFLATSGRSFAWNHSYPRLTAYNQAVYRLRKQGLIARRDARGGAPTLTLTMSGKRLVSDEMVPERFWRQQWDGNWYLLMYDIPERQRRYRHALHYFLRRMRMGTLQKSVFVSPRDIRPLFHDLAEAAAIQEYANIFEARTVLGHSHQAIVAKAWEMEQLHIAQSEYIDGVAKRSSQELPRGFAAVLPVLRDEIADYRQVMELDPLLPEALWPPGYLGHKVVAAFRKFVRRLMLNGAILQAR